MPIAQAAPEGSGYAGDERADYHGKRGKKCGHFGGATSCVCRSLYLPQPIIHAALCFGL
jgi:hypothetical protein